ncbi:DUF3592 domain-containing protein [Marinicella marina]|uniref:DUF3592 domain-containing protein n=1 Tax=Marinicella marina TaxID=2996016 RepID=UPI0024BC18F9|nr:DUF3592 domain-containing protein [Marinicella marina]MDJ1140778.1 DUF3592 domain-containing protein [Marinicella marina]
MKKIGWGFGALTVLFFVVGAWLLFTAAQSMTWPSVDGKVVESKVVGRINQAGDTLRRYIDYVVEVKYSYFYQGELYFSERYSLGTGTTVKDGFDDKYSARVWLLKSPFTADQPVTVYFDPDNPQSSVLKTGILWSTWVPMIMALCCGVLTWMCFWLNLKVLTQNKEQAQNQ